MPGVPSSKACNACRKVKKKCDELQPCSRCLRRQLSCEGSGEQRYQFKSSQLQRQRPRKRVTLANPSCRIPPTSCNRLAAWFVNTLDIKDIRFDVSIFGSFLKDLPQRLGESLVLDAATQALVSLYPFLRGLYRREVPRDVLMLYGKSLRALRECLDDPVEVRSPYTLCAVYLISICQGWLGRNEKQSVSHARAIAHLLRVVDLRKCNGGFERQLIVTLSVPVILEEICNPRIRMAPNFWEDVMALIQQGSPEPDDRIPRFTTTLLSLSKFPEYLHHPYAHRAEILAVYSQLREDAQKIHPYLNEPSEPAGLSSPVVWHGSRYRAAYTVLITLALLLNAPLRAVDSDSAILAKEAVFFCERIVHEADMASRYRPLGAAFAVPCLVVALAAADDPQQQACIEATLADYQTDYGEVDWRKLAMWLRAVYHNYRGETALIPTDMDVSASKVPGSCCVMSLQAIFGLCLRLDYKRTQAL